MKFREHFGDYARSMDTVVEISSFDELVCYIQKLLLPWGVKVTKDKVKVTSYCDFDRRNGWNTYIVSVDDYGVIGFTDGGFTDAEIN